MRQADDPGLFPAPQFGQVIIFSFLVFFRILFRLSPVAHYTQAYFSWKQKSGGQFGPRLSGYESVGMTLGSNEFIRFHAGETASERINSLLRGNALLFQPFVVTNSFVSALARPHQNE